jgi:AcrR family transcriptional regulator
VATDHYAGPRHRRAPLASREQVVDQAMDLLDAEGSTGLSMRKLAAALGVSLPTIYAAVASRNALVQDVLRAALLRDVRAVSRRVTEGGDPPTVLAAMVEATSSHPWLHELAQELDTDTLLHVAEAVVSDARPSVFDRLVENLTSNGAASATGRDPGGGGSGASGGSIARRPPRQSGAGAASRSPRAAERLDPAQLLFLVMLLLDDVARLVDAGRCPADQQGRLGQALLFTMLEPLADRAGTVSVG